MDTLKVVNGSSKIVYKNNYNQIHRPYESGPAIYYFTGTKEYRNHGLLHRPYKHGPAYIGFNGTQMYFEHHIRHRPVEDGPAIIWYDNNKTPVSFEYYEYGYEIADPKEWYEKKLKATKIIQKNWRICSFNSRFRELLTQVLLVPENHNSILGKIYPNGGYMFKKIKHEIENF
jgi:hypothetical protein